MDSSCRHTNTDRIKSLENLEVKKKKLVPSLFQFIPLASKGFPIKQWRVPSEHVLYLLEIQLLPTNVVAHWGARIRVYLSTFLPEFKGERVGVGGGGSLLWESLKLQACQYFAFELFSQKNKLGERFGPRSRQEMTLKWSIFMNPNFWFIYIYIHKD